VADRDSEELLVDGEELLADGEELLADGEELLADTEELEDIDDGGIGVLLLLVVPDDADPTQAL